MKVLLIEDNLNFTFIVEQMLLGALDGQNGIESSTTLAGGIDHYQRTLSDVILLDLTLPDSRGTEGLARLRATVGDTPIIVLTGVNDDALALEAMRQGAQDYLIKGQIDADSLARAVRYAVERKRTDLRLQRERQKHSALHEISLANTSALNLWSVLHTIVDQVHVLFPQLGIAIWLRNDESTLCEPFARWHIDDANWSGLGLTRDQNFIDAIAGKRHPCFFNGEGELVALATANRDLDTQLTSIYIPLLVADQVDGLLGD